MIGPDSPDQENQLHEASLDFADFLESLCTSHGLPPVSSFEPRSCSDRFTPQASFEHDLRPSSTVLQQAKRPQEAKPEASGPKKVRSKEDNR